VKIYQVISNQKGIMASMTRTKQVARKQQPAAALPKRRARVQKKVREEEQEDEEDREEELPKRRARAQAKTASRAQVAAMLHGRQALLRSISRTSYTPPNVPPVILPHSCPGCTYKPTIDEVFAGFVQNPIDVKTKCPSCGKRFLATLDVNDGAFFVALCPDQTMDQYLELQENGTLPGDMPITSLFDVAPHIAWNAYWHSPLRKDANLSVVEKVISFLLSKRE